MASSAYRILKTETKCRRTEVPWPWPAMGSPRHRDPPRWQKTGFPAASHWNLPEGRTLPVLRRMPALAQGLLFFCGFATCPPKRLASHGPQRLQESLLYLGREPDEVCLVPSINFRDTGVPLPLGRT